MKNSKTGTIGITITIIVLIIIIILSNVGTDRISIMQNGITKVFMPVQNAFVFIKDKITGNNQELSDIENLKKENQNLKEENTKLKQAERELEILKSENNTLKEYLDLKNKYGTYSTIPAYLIERTYSNYDKIIVINVGTKDNIKVNMPVISESGLVGHIISVTENTAKVQTILDTASNVSSEISTADESILIKGVLGNNKQTKATNIPAESTIMPGDTVVTSGLGGIYPKGILIGTIKEVINTKNEMDRYAYIDTATNFEKLKTVLVITGDSLD